MQNPAGIAIVYFHSTETYKKTLEKHSAAFTFHSDTYSPSHRATWKKEALTLWKYQSLWPLACRGNITSANSKDIFLEVHGWLFLFSYKLNLCLELHKVDLNHRFTQLNNFDTQLPSCEQGHWLLSLNYFMPFWNRSHVIFCLFGLWSLTEITTMGNKREKENKKAPELCFKAKVSQDLLYFSNVKLKVPKGTGINFSNKNQNSFPGSTAQAVLFGS